MTVYKYSFISNKIFEEKDVFSDNSEHKEMMGTLFTDPYPHMYRHNNSAADRNTFIKAVIEHKTETINNLEKEIDREEHSLSVLNVELSEPLVLYCYRIRKGNPAVEVTKFNAVATKKGYSVHNTTNFGSTFFNIPRNRLGKILADDNSGIIVYWSFKENQSSKFLSAISSETIKKYIG